MPTVYWLACEEGEPPAADDWLSDRDRKRFSTMTYTKRYEEARLSRWTAQSAVAMFSGHDDPAEVQVSNNPDGSPWARTADGQPVAISSTDRAGWAVSVVTEGECRIGCDLELVEPRSPLFVRDYFTGKEQAFLSRATLDFDLAANLIWSAKESALKVLRTGLRRDTRTVEVDIPAPSDDDWSPLSVTADDAVFPGWWRRFGDFLLTVAVDQAVPVPVSLIEPPPLSTARPSHSWMNRPLR